MTQILQTEKTEEEVPEPFEFIDIEYDVNSQPTGYDAFIESLENGAHK